MFHGSGSNFIENNNFCLLPTTSHALQSLQIDIYCSTHLLHIASYMYFLRLGLDPAGQNSSEPDFKSFYVYLWVRDGYNGKK